MAVDEVRLRLRRQLEEMFGAEGASILMDRPPGGWNDLVTNQSLDLKIDSLRSELHTDMSELRAELRGELHTGIADLRGEMAELRSDVRHEMAGMRVEMANLSASVARRLRAQAWVTTSTILASVGVAVTLAAALGH